MNARVCMTVNRLHTHTPVECGSESPTLPSHLSWEVWWSCCTAGTPPILPGLPAECLRGCGLVAMAASAGSTPTAKASHKRKREIEFSLVRRPNDKCLENTLFNLLCHTHATTLHYGCGWFT